MFPGQVLGVDGSETEVELTYHVRPLGHGLDYDWPRLEKDLADAGVGRVLHMGGSRALSLSARWLVAFWEERMREDPLYLIDEAARTWVAPKLEELGRRFEILDFEPSEELV